MKLNSNNNNNLSSLFRDRFRTMVNIVADCLGAGLISELVKKENKRVKLNVQNYEIGQTNKEFE